MDGMITHRGLALLTANSTVVSNWIDWHAEHQNEALPPFRITLQAMLITEENISPILESLEAYCNSRGSVKRDKNHAHRAWLDRFIAELRRLIEHKVALRHHYKPRTARIPHEEYQERYVEEIIRLTEQRAKKPEMESYTSEELQRYLKVPMKFTEEIPKKILSEFRCEAEARLVEINAPVVADDSSDQSPSKISEEPRLSTDSEKTELTNNTVAKFASPLSLSVEDAKESPIQRMQSMFQFLAALLENPKVGEIVEQNREASHRHVLNLLDITNDWVDFVSQSREEN